MDNKIDAPNFIREFHCNDGITIKDRQHNLHQLLRKYSKLNTAELDTICLDLKPKTHLEKTFRIDFLIYFKRTEELYQEFQSGDDITICKIAKHDWFFKKSFEKYSVDEFVNSVLPTMSFSTRMKILKRFNGNEELNDAMFDALKERYGLFRSSVWLTKCSVKKIKETLEEYPNFRLTENQLKTVFEKDKNLIMFYYDRFEYGSDSNHKSLLALIAQKDPGMLLELLKKHNNLGKDIDLGRRNTCNFIAAKKKEILENPEEFFYLLKPSALRRKLGADSIIFVEKLFPTKVDDVGCFSDSSHDFLMHFPPKTRFETFKTVYNKHFNEKFEDNPNAISVKLLKYVIFDKFEREKYALIKYNQEQDNDYLEYVTPERCFKEFTSKMSKMGMRQRATFIRILTECCVLNKDLETLLKVCELVSNRFKNDDSELHVNFINALHDLNFIKLLNEEHFKHVFKIFANDTNNRIYLRSEFYFGYFEYLLRNNKPIKEILFKAPEELKNFALSEIKDKNLFKQILLEMLELPIPKELEEDDENNITSYESTLIRCCIDYSKKCPKDQLQLLDYEITRKAIYKSIKNDGMEYWGNTNYIEYVVKSSSHHPNAEFIEFAETMFKEIKTVENTRDIMVYMLRKHPKLLEKHFDQFLEKFRGAHFNKSVPLWGLIKKYSHLELDKRVVDFCATKLNSDDEDLSGEHYIRPLSMLMEPQNYRDLIKRFIPDEAKVDLEDEQQKEKYLIQSKIAWSLTHFEHPFSILPLVLEFCKGDFLKYALRPLYSNMYRLQEEITGEFIEKLNQVDAISVRKHGLYLCCEISDEKTILQMLKSSPLPIVLSCLRFLKKNPSEECWELVEQTLNKLKKTDEPLFETIEQLGVPKEFAGRFFETLWKIFTKFNIKKYNSSLLKKLDKKTIKQVSESFINDLLLNHLFETEEIDDFLVLLLLHDDETNWYENFLTSLENIKEKHEKKFPLKINNLIKKFYGEYLNESNKRNLKLIKKFAGDFTGIFEIEQFFEEYVILELIKQKGESIENIAEFILELQLELVKKYGELIIDQFQGIIYTVTMNSMISDMEHLNFCTEVLKRAQNKTDYLLVIRLLPNHVPEDAANNSKYTAIINTLKSVNDLIVKICLSSYFKLLP